MPGTFEPSYGRIAPRAWVRWCDCLFDLGCAKMHAKTSKTKHHMCAHASTSRSLSLLSSGQKGGVGSVAARDGDVQGGDLKVLAVVVCNLDTHANLKLSGEDVVRKGKVIDFRAHFGDLEVTERRGRGEKMAERTVEGWRRRWRRERSRGERKEGGASEEGVANALASREERTLT